MEKEKSFKATKTLYVSDLDGTLFGADSRVSATSAAILNKAISAGVMFTPATARTPATVQPLLSAIEQSVYTDATGVQHHLPAIVMTGAALWDRQTANFESRRFIDAADAQTIYNLFQSRGLQPFVYCLSDNGFINVYHPAQMNEREDAFYQERRHLQLKHFNLDQEPPRWDNVVLFFAIGPVAPIAEASQQLNGLTPCAAAWYPDILLPETGLIDIYAPGVSKAKAVKELAKQTGAERVVVFGDNLNDLPMMRVADLAVAVENALPEVKAEADVVIGPNTADAVARYIAEVEHISI
jgi:hypothetical protein